MITLAADGAVPANPARWREAVDHHAARTPVPRSTWDAMEAQARQRAFTVSGITSTQLLADVHAAIGEAVTNGTTLRDFKRQMEARLTAEWGAPNAARVETIFRTNVQTAYNAGRHAQMTTPTAMALRPYFAFQAILDKRTSDTCSPLDKVTRPAGDEFWDSHWPPLHFNCRSTVTSLSRREFDRLAASPTGVKTEAVRADGRAAKPPLPGFGATPDLAGRALAPSAQTSPDLHAAYNARATRTPASSSRPGATSIRDTNQLLTSEERDRGMAESVGRPPLDELVRQTGVTFVPSDLPLTLTDARGNTFEALAIHDPVTNVIVHSPYVGEYRGFFNAGDPFVDEGASSAPDAFGRVITHELGHAVHEASDAATRQRIADLYVASRRGANGVSTYARDSESEYFAESFGAYFHEPDELMRQDPEAYRLVRDILRSRGINHDPLRRPDAP